MSDEEVHEALSSCHAELGGMLARSWGVPADVLTVIRRHHSSDDATGLVYLVQQADTISHTLGYGIPEPENDEVYLESGFAEPLLDKIDTLLGDYV